MMLTKLEAIKKFRSNNNWTYTKQLIVEGVSNGENTVDKKSRKIWGNYLQSSNFEPMIEKNCILQYGNLTFNVKYFNPHHLVSRLL